MSRYQVELIWNREFDWCNYAKPFISIEFAIAIGKDILNSGDGARVKKFRARDIETNEIVYPK